MSDTRKDAFRFDVAFSFSGEQRDVVRDIATALSEKLGRPRIFYDEWYQAELARPSADIYLQQIYQDSHLVVVCQGRDYERQPWVQLEWDAIRNLIIRSHDADSRLRIFPIRFGDEPIPSVFASAAFLDAKGRTVDEIASLIIERLKQLQAEEKTSTGSPVTTPHERAHTPATRDDADEVFISYSWRHDSAVPMVDDLCAALENNGVNIVRDKTHIETGDRISQFIDRLGKGGCVIVVLSDPYLKSQYCMYELYRIYATASLDTERFLNRVIPLIHDEIKIGRPIERIRYAAFWKRERDELDAAAREFGPDVMGHEDHKALRRMSEFALFVSDMLAYLNDKCIPRNIDEVKADDFRVVCELVRRAVKR